MRKGRDLIDDFQIRPAPPEENLEMVQVVLDRLGR
jgi:hypothetical protein